MASAEAGGDLVLAAWVDFAECRRAFGPILAKLALLPIDGVRPWVRLLADPGRLDPWTHLTLEIRDTPDPAVRARLWHRSEAPGFVDRTP